ncbi:MAG: 50S ribosomal protein L11 [bacterium]
MAAKKQIKTKLKMQIQAGQANPAPPVGPTLSQHGVNIMTFCKEFNEKSKDKVGFVIPVEITVYADRTYSFVLKTPPVAQLIKKAIAIEKGAADPKRQKVGKISKSAVLEIAKQKLHDLNTPDLNAAARIVAGTARSMGVEVEG